MSPKKPNKRKSKPGPSHSPTRTYASSSPGSAGERGFSFKDRTGKIHGRSPKAQAQPSERAAAPRRVVPPAPGKRLDRPSRPATQLKATVDKNHKGFGFLIFEDRTYEDAFISPRDADQFFHGDRVQVEIDSRGNVQEIQVIQHRFRELVGRYSPHPAGPHMGGWVIYERKRAREEVYIPEPGPSVKPGDWIKVLLEFHEKGQFNVTGAISEIFGPELPPSADIGMVAAEYNLIEEHSAEAETQARALKLEVPGRDLEGREDFRKIPFITIDGETARDFDDAIYVERSGLNFVLWVAIADVSHYVVENTALDQEARSRGTSVYFPERAFHMLPRALSENLCSLKPYEPRLSLVAKMQYDRHGTRLSTQLYEAVIQSHRRATYNQIQAEWEMNGKDPAWEFAPHFELYHQIRKKRADRGSIDFDLPEAELKVEPTGEVISIKQRPRLDAHRLIEEFMIAANESVTEWMMEKAWPFVYRIHEEPAMQSLLKFQRLAATAGIHFEVDTEAANSPKILADLVRRLEGNPAQELLNTALLRSMKQAIYSSTHGTHFGLASPGYTHFTSPIRRYPDLVVHRLLRWALRVTHKKQPPLKVQEREKLEKDLAEITEHCSYRERIASDAERESIRLKQVRMMTRHVGEEFDGKIIGMLESGFFVQLGDPYCEGMVNKDTLMDDFYQFNEDQMIFFGRRTRKTFRMGDVVHVRVLRADIDTRKVDFGLTTQALPSGTGTGTGPAVQPGKKIAPRSHIAPNPQKKPKKGPTRGRSGRERRKK